MMEMLVSLCMVVFPLFWFRTVLERRPREAALTRSRRPMERRYTGTQSSLKGDVGYLLTNGLRIHLGVQAVEVVNTEDKCPCNLAVAQVGEVEDGGGS